MLEKIKREELRTKKARNLVTELLLKSPRRNKDNRFPTIDVTENNDEIKQKLYANIQYYKEFGTTYHQRAQDEFQNADLICLDDKKTLDLLKKMLLENVLELTAPKLKWNEELECILLDPVEFDPFSVKTRIDIFEAGLSGHLFKKICILLEISEKRLAEIIRTSVSTLASRKKRGYFSPTESERLYRILNLYKLAVRVFDNNTDHAKKWLKEEAYGLNGEIPLEFAKTEIGAREVELLLNRIDQGLFS